MSETPLTEYYGILNASEKPADAQEEQKVGLIMIVLDPQWKKADNAAVLDQSIAPACSGKKVHRLAGFPDTLRSSFSLRLR